MRYIEIHKNGTIRTFKNDFDLDLKSKTEIRVSRILPKNIFLRFTFILLRKLFGDDGKIANWTRNWRCTWIVIIDGKIIGEFQNRKDAILFEKKYVISNKFRE